MDTSREKIDETFEWESGTIEDFLKELNDWITKTVESYK
jgi:hypothetical protein